MVGLEEVASFQGELDYHHFFSEKKKHENDDFFFWGGELETLDFQPKSTKLMAENLKLWNLVYQKFLSGWKTCDLKFLNCSLFLRS